MGVILWLLPRIQRLVRVSVILSVIPQQQCTQQADSFSQYTAGGASDLLTKHPGCKFWRDCACSCVNLSSHSLAWMIAQSTCKLGTYMRKTNCLAATALRGYRRQAMIALPCTIRTCS